MSHNPLNYDRRVFLSKAASGIATLGMFDVSSKFLSYDRTEGKKIIHRQLGQTDIQVPVVSMGVNTTQPPVVKTAFGTGVRLFSTAHTYQNGLCEQAIGDAIQDLRVRDRVIVATKIPTGLRRDGTWEKDIKGSFLGRLSKSLERLQSDYLDILYLYNIRKVEEIGKPELLDMLTELKQRKQVRYVGFTAHANHGELLKACVEMGFYDVIALSFNYTMSEDLALAEALEKTAAKGIGLVAMKTQCGGTWGTDGYRKPKEQPKNQTAMLKWVLRHDFISTAIPAMESHEHVKEDFSVVYDLGFTPEERRFLDDENTKYNSGFCQQCGKCAGFCPHAVDIPILMRAHMYAFQYHNNDLASLAQKEMEAGNSISQCVLCGECKAVCFHAVPIAQNIEDLKKLNWT